MRLHKAKHESLQCLSYKYFSASQDRGDLTQLYYVYLAPTVFRLSEYRSVKLKQLQSCLTKEMFEKTGLAKYSFV